MGMGRGRTESNGHRLDGLGPFPTPGPYRAYTTAEVASSGWSHPSRDTLVGLNGYLVQFIGRELNDLKPRTGPRRDLSTHNLGNKQPPKLSPKKKKIQSDIFRTGYANLRANKYEGRQAWCNLCDMKEAETEAHVLLRCPSFVAQRAELLYDLGQVWNADKLNRWSSLQDTDRVAAILSNEAEHRDTERAVDSAIKRMLTKIEDAGYRPGPTNSEDSAATRS